MRRALAAELLAVAAAAVCAAGIQLVQPKLAVGIRKVHLTDDSSALPPPRELRALSLGYRAAGADLVWASLIVEHGLRSKEKRPFESLPRYFDGILALDPTHPTLYRFADTLIVFKTAGVPNEADARLARGYLEQGTRERPYDHETWLHYGQFLAFLAPSILKDPAEVQAWRRDGAFAIARSVELGADPDRSLAATTILSQSGEKKAAIEHLQRTYALTDDPEIRRQVLFKLRRLEGSVDVQTSVDVIEREWHTRYPFLSRGGTLLVGPYRDPARCAGPAARIDKACAPDWTAATSGSGP